MTMLFFKWFLFFCFPVPPLFVVEFLHRVVDTFEDYFQGCGESILKEHYVIVYEVKTMYMYCEILNAML